MTTSKHAFYNPNPSKKTDVEDCVVRAYCKAFDAEWGDMVVLSTLFAMKDSRLLNDNKVIPKFLEYVGCVRHTVRATKGSKRPTADSLSRKRENKDKTFVCSVASHVVTVKNGKYYDTWDSGEKGIYYYYEVPQEAKDKVHELLKDPMIGLIKGAVEADGMFNTL